MASWTDVISVTCKQDEKNSISCTITRRGADSVKDLKVNIVNIDPELGARVMMNDRQETSFWSDKDFNCNAERTVPFISGRKKLYCTKNSPESLSVGTPNVNFGSHEFLKHGKDLRDEMFEQKDELIRIISSGKKSRKKDSFRF